MGRFREHLADRGPVAMLEGNSSGQLIAMAVLRAIARPMLASIFIVQGYDTLRHPEKVVKKAHPVVEPIARRVSFVPDDTEQAVRVNGAVQLVAGTLLAVGWFPRLSALAIAGSLVPTTAAGHRFWEETDDQDRAQQKIHFLKNLVMFGGLLIAAGDTAGRPSLAWRSRHAAQSAKRDVSRKTKSARRSGKSAAKAAKAKSKGKLPVG
jgi:putative oxidoreductase